MQAGMKVYEAKKWIGDGREFIYSHALNRRLNQEEHCHDFYEIIYLFSGFGEHRVNGKMQRVSAGDITVLRPGDAHLFVEQSDMLELFSISAKPAEMERFLETYRLRADMVEAAEAPVFRMGSVQASNVLKLFYRLTRLSDESEREAVLRVILGMTMEHYTLLKLDKERDWFQSILFHMRKPENLQEGVPAMMRIANLSHAQLCRVMRKKGLQPPKVYIKELRLSTAYELIQNTSLSYEDIAQQVGYASVSHFSTAFRMRYGTPPGALRRMSDSQLL